MDGIWTKSWKSAFFENNYRFDMKIALCIDWKPKHIDFWILVYLAMFSQFLYATGNLHPFRTPPVSVQKSEISMTRYLTKIKFIPNNIRKDLYLRSKKRWKFWSYRTGHSCLMESLAFPHAGNVWRFLIAGNVWRFLIAGNVWRFLIAGNDWRFLMQEMFDSSSLQEMFKGTYFCSSLKTYFLVWLMYCAFEPYLKSMITF